MHNIHIRLIAYAAILFFASNFAGCKKSANDSLHGVNNASKKIAVYIDEDMNDPDNVNEIFIGEILMDNTGKMKVRIVKEGKFATLLNNAVQEIEKRKTLSIQTEDKVGSAYVLRDEQLLPSNPKYVWAVARVLKIEYFFECHIE